MNRSCGTHRHHPGTSTRPRRAPYCKTRPHPRPLIRAGSQTSGSRGTFPRPVPSSVGIVTERAAADETLGREGTAGDVADLIPMLRRIVAARVGNHPSAEDLVQETLVRVLAARDRIEPGMVEPYAIATVRNVMATMWRQQDREQRNRHRVHDPSEPEQAAERVVATEEQRAIAEAVRRLDDTDRRMSARTRDRRRAHQNSRTGPGHHVRRGCRTAQARPSPAACRVPLGPRAGRTTHGAVSRRPAGALQRRPTTPAGGRSRSAPPGVRPLLPTQ